MSEHSLLNQAPEVFERILNNCMSNHRECKSNVRLRLVCRLFDEVLSRRILDFYKVETAQFSKYDSEWPQGSVDWLLSNRVLMHDGRTDVKGGAVFASIYNAADAMHRLYLEKQGEAPSMRILVRRTSKAALAFWTLRDLMRLKYVDPSVVNTQPLELLPLFAFVGDMSMMADILLPDDNEAQVRVNYHTRLFGDALYAAAAADQVQTVSWLLLLGAKINPEGGRWGSPLGASLVHANSPDTFSILLKAGARIHEPDPSLPIIVPAGGEIPQPPTINLSSQTGVPAEETPFLKTGIIYTAVARGKFDAIGVLFAHPDVTSPVVEEYFHPVISSMCKTGDAPGLQNALEKNTKIKDSEYEFSELFLPVLRSAWDNRFREGQDQVVKVLLDHGARPDRQYRNGRGSAVDIAVDIWRSAKEKGVEVPPAVDRLVWWDNEKGTREEHAFLLSVAKRISLMDSTSLT